MSDSDAATGKPQSYTRKTLGKSDDKPKAPEIYKCCSNPQITYLAPVNINIDERTIGSVDTWRCAVCMKTFCEEKTLGIKIKIIKGLATPPVKYIKKPNCNISITKNINADLSDNCVFL